MGLESVEAGGQVKYAKKHLDIKEGDRRSVVTVNELVGLSKSSVEVGKRDILESQFSQVRLIINQDQDGTLRLCFCPLIEAETEDLQGELINGVLVGVKGEVPTYYLLRPNDLGNLPNNDNEESLAAEGDQTRTKIEIRATNRLELEEGKEYFLVFVHLPPGDRDTAGFTARIKGSLREKGGLTWLDTAEAHDQGWRYVTLGVKWERGHLYPDKRGVEILRVIR